MVEAIHIEPPIEERPIEQPLKIRGIAVGTLRTHFPLFPDEKEDGDAPNIQKLKASLKRRYGAVTIDVLRVPRRIWRERQLELEALENDVSEAESSAKTLPAKERAAKINTAVEALRARTKEILLETFELDGNRVGPILKRVRGITVEGADGVAHDIEELIPSSAIDEVAEVDLLEIVAGAVNRAQLATRAQKN